MIFIPNQIIKYTMTNYNELLQSLNLTFDPDYKGDVLSAKFHYKGNKGFFHVFNNKFSLLLLKSIHKDFIRVLNGEPNIEERTLSKISDFLSNIERNHTKTLKIDLYLKDDEIVITKIEDDQVEFEELKPFEISYPLTKVEYHLFKDSSDKNLYTKTLFNGIFPETITYFTNSIIKTLPDVLNPLFMYANFKTFSPSIKTIFNKPYLNINNIDIWSSTLNIDRFYFNLNFAQYLFIKEKYKKIKLPEIKLLSLSYEEFIDIIKELEETIENYDENFILGENFNNFISIYVMAQEMLQLYLMDGFLNLYKIVEDIDLSLKMIFQTRNNPLIGSKPIKIFNFFDVNADFKDIHYTPIPCKDLNILIQQMPKIRAILHKKKIIAFVENLHNLLNIRDKLFLFTQKVIEKTKSALEKLAEEFISLMQIKNKDDIYYLELSEIKQIKENNFYGNIAFNLYFRKAQSERFKIQQTPTEIFEKDIDNVEEIIRKVYEKSISNRTFKALTLFFKSDITSYYILKNPSLFYLDQIKDKDAIITQNIPLLSPLMEFCALTEKTIFTGIKMPNIALEGKKIRFKSDEVIIEQ